LHRVTTLYQLKHTLKSAASLTDASPQLWTIYPSEDPRCRVSGCILLAR
jgi:hypothetical protein